MKKISTLLLGLALSFQTFACTDGDGFFPKNNWRIPSDRKYLGGLSEEEFNQTISKIENYYSSIVSSHGGRLHVIRDWNDPTVNAFANRQGNTWQIKMYGGLARHPAMSTDGFALVLCHELGHHLGGAPKYREGGSSWASNEGQSDYFAVAKCMRKVFENDDNINHIQKLNIPNSVKTKCREHHSNENDAAICMRSSMGGLATSTMFAQMSNGSMPSFDNPDQSKVSQTYDKHPHYQCRLDTYFSGSVCEVDKDDDVSQTNPNKGTCNRADNFDHGLRPLCWYKPSGSSNPPTDPGNPGDISPRPTINGKSEFSSNNPNIMIPISINLSGIQNAVGFVIEATKPNRTFSNPNDIKPDPINSLGYEIYSGTVGIYQLIPAQKLPSWGSYEFRILPLDRMKKPLRKFSDPVKVHLQP